jgi:V/A-type H+/Na+-transporting ATPase subunit C
MASRLLTPGALETLIDGGLEDERAVLTRSGLASLATDLEAGRFLEQSITHLLLADILILSRATSGDAQNFLIFWTRRHEFTHLKTLLRGRMAHATQAEIRAQLADLGPFSTLPLDDLLRTEDMAELLRRLETTPYADMVRFARRAFERQPSLFALDSALNRRYYHGLIQHARPLEQAAGRAFSDLMALLIDRVNLVWMLRYRHAYGLPPAEVFFLLIPAGYRLKSDQLKALALLPRLEEVLAGLPVPYAGWLARAESIDAVSRILDEHLARAARAVLRSAAPAIARTFAYLILRERDLRRVRAVLKGRALGIAPAIIRLAVGLAPAARVAAA